MCMCAQLQTGLWVWTLKLVDCTLWTAMGTSAKVTHRSSCIIVCMGQARQGVAWNTTRIQAGVRVWHHGRIIASRPCSTGLRRIGIGIRRISSWLCIRVWRWGR